MRECDGGSQCGSWLVGTRAWCSDGEATGLPRPTCRFSPSETVDQAVETYGLQKITLLREISLKTGIQVGMTQGVPPVPLFLQGSQPLVLGGRVAFS